MILDSHFTQHTPPFKAIGHGWLWMPESGGNQPPLSRLISEVVAAETSLYKWGEK